MALSATHSQAVPLICMAAMLQIFIYNPHPANRGGGPLDQLFLEGVIGLSAGGFKVRSRTSMVNSGESEATM